MQIASSWRHKNLWFFLLISTSLLLHNRNRYEVSTLLLLYHHVLLAPLHARSAFFLSFPYANTFFSFTSPRQLASRIPRLQLWIYESNCINKTWRLLHSHMPFVTIAVFFGACFATQIYQIYSALVALSFAYNWGGTHWTDTFLSGGLSLCLHAQ